MGGALPVLAGFSLLAFVPTLALFLPLVRLSFFQPFYRARFFELLNLPQADPSAGVAKPPRIVDLPQSAGTTTARGTEK